MSDERAVSDSDLYRFITRQRAIRPDLNEHGFFLYLALELNVAFHLRKRETDETV